MKPLPIDECTPLDRPIMVFALADDAEDWPLGVQAAVAIWYETVMRRYITKWRRPGDEDPAKRDLSCYKYWSMTDVPQGAIDSSLDFDPTHWFEIPVLP